MFKQPEGPAAHAFGALTFGFILSLLMSVGIAACGTLMLVLNFGSEFSGPIMVIGAIVPLVLTRDFARRFCFANLRMREALALDAGASLLQLFCLATLAWQGMLGASTALASIVGFHELTKTAQILTNATFQPFVIYGLVALIYFAICYPMTKWSRILERQFAVDKPA